MDVVVVGEQEQRLPVFAERLSHLFATVTGPDGKPWSLTAVARVLTDQYDLPTTQSYVSQLRSGVRTNPTINYVAALASIFGVPTSYLVDSGPQVLDEAELDLLAALRSAGVVGIAMRAKDVPRASQKMVAQMLDSLREQEGLPPIT